MQNKKLILYQIRIDMSEDEAKKIRQKISSILHLQLLEILSNFNAKLICQYDAFNDFVKECEIKGETKSPLYKWTKDTINNENKKKNTYSLSLFMLMKANYMIKKLQTVLKQNSKISIIKIY